MHNMPSCICLSIEELRLIAVFEINSLKMTSALLLSLDSLHCIIHCLCSEVVES